MVEVRVAAVHGLLDEALVDSPLDLEVSVESPGWPPGVRNEPIGDLVLDTPPDDLDGVPSRDEVGEVPPRPAVHSTLVREEALMHEEAGLDLSRRTGKGGRVGESAFWRCVRFGLSGALTGPPVMMAFWMSSTVDSL